jgi:signal transduction histidine kinase
MLGVHKYFAIASALVMLVAMIVLGVGYQHYQIRNLVEVAENSNVVLANTLSKIIHSPPWPHEYSDGELDSDTLQPLREMERIASFLRITTEDSGILKVKIYSLDGMTLYSSDQRDVGENRLMQPHESVFLIAAEGAAAQSQLSFENQISAFSGELFDRDVVETYVPMKNISGSVVGVLEIYADVTGLKRRIDKLIPTAFFSLLTVFLLLYGTLVLVVLGRAMAPIRLASQRAAMIGPRTSGVRLPTENMAAEISPLIEAINGALDRLDAALEAQRQFTADAAHELLTPLAVLKTNLDTLEDETAASLEKDVSVLSEIVRQLLELAELDSLDPETSEALDLREVCVEVAAMMAPVAHKENKRIEIINDGAEIRVCCNQQALVRALRNLVANAIVFAPQDSAIVIYLESDGAIRVVDKGPGIPVDKRDLIFQRFWRGTRGNRPGAGLGLSIVKRFANMYEGTIEVGDAPDGGAEFTLRLPPLV